MAEYRLRDGDYSDAEGSPALSGFSSAEAGGLPMHPTFESRLPTASANPQHICVVTETYPPEINGVALTLANLVKGLLARGNAVSVIHPKQRGLRTFNDFATSSYSEAIQVRGLPLPGYHGLQFGAPAGRLLRQHWREHPPAVVYIATEGPLGLSAVRAARRLNIPTVSGFHTNFHSYCRHYGVSWLQNIALRYLRWFHNQTECTLVTNEELRGRLQGGGFNKVSIVERGVDSQLFNPKRRCAELRRQWGCSDQDLAMVYVGRIAPEKNLQLATAAYREMKRLNARNKFIVVGDGPLRRRLQREDTDVIFAGMQTGEQLARHYASADVFLFPSETETFGNVTLEAMASGLAVIAYDYAAARVHIRQGETGA